jgi:hypothetical protein
MNIPRRILPVLVAALSAAGCTALDAVAVGQTDRLGDPPFVLHYAPDRAPVTAPGDVVVLAPVALDRQTMRDVLAPSQAEAFRGLADAMDARLEAMACCVFSSAPLSDDGAPLVYVGSAAGSTAPPEAEPLVTAHQKYPPMILHLDRPSAAWQARVAAQPKAAAFLWIRLALVDYPRADEGAFGKKVVLGEGHEIPQPFLRTELQPLQVLQVTGALVAPDGSVLAAGAEGIFAVDTPFRAQIFNLQREIDPAQIQAILTEARREDLPGQPLKWEAALDNLVARLLRTR